ncbi:MAG: YdcF family protein [Deltaproteobacteria bacterium]|nr:YdcF family protein [Deltaproteobacteria bacterium]
MMAMFVLKKMVSRLLFPLSLIMELLLLGIFLKKRRTLVCVMAVALLYLFSFSPFAHLILRPLESRYVPVTAADLNREVKWIVVLSGGSRADKGLTPEDRLGAATLKRLLEGVRLSRLLPQARLILSGGDYRGMAPDALFMRQVALDLGVPRERILVESASWDTADQAAFLKGRLGRNAFYLVTSASHMPRSMRIFTRSGVRPIAAPTDYQAVSAGSLAAMDFVPAADALANTETAFYEYLGIAWESLKAISTFLPPI